MAGFGIIDTSCTPEAYANAFDCTKPTECNVFQMQYCASIEYLKREWRFIFFSSQRLPVCIVAFSITFILGYQVGISGGLTIIDSFLSTFFPIDDDHDHHHNHFSKFKHPGLSLFISSFYTAALAAWLMFAPSMSGLRWRKPMMVLASICLLWGATLTCFATTLTTLVGGRILLGSGIGVSLHIMPIYVSKITPMNPRILFYVFHAVVSLGALSGGCASMLGWRIGLGFAILPALAALVFSKYLPNVDEDQVTKWPWRELFLKKNRLHLVIATLLPLLQQLTGISLIVLFTPTMLHAMADPHDEGLILTTAFIPQLWLVTMSFCEFIAPFLKISRRNLVVMFGVVMVIVDNHIADTIGWLKLTPSSPDKYCSISGNKWLFVRLIHVGSSGWEYISWTFLNETLPREIRGVAWRLSMSMVLICYALVAQFGIHLLEYLQLKMFAIMSSLVILGMLIFYTLLPDNKWSRFIIGPVVYLWDNHSLWKGVVDARR